MNIELNGICMYTEFKQTFDRLKSVSGSNSYEGHGKT